MNGQRFVDPCDPSSGQFVMLGKTPKGMSDEMLAWQTRKRKALEVAHDAHTAYESTELVVEIAFNGIQASPHYPGGLALRVARGRGYRPDKRTAEADTVRAMFAAQSGRSGMSSNGGAKSGITSP